ncbi:hypothetical protein [Coleofasciculus chthonoplastes]|uniref:hypothetical protein n=1 Tax=Coleofasciculus chthonoplastes TaxID=64178 RepID=UPI0032FF5220
MTTYAPIQTLIAQICGNPQPTPWQRRRLMNRLLISLQNMPGLLRSSHLDYLEALDLTWEWVSRNICDFEPRSQESVSITLVRWINSYLYWRIRDLSKPELPGQYRLNQAIDTSGEGITTLLDKLSTTTPTIPVLSGIEQYIEQQHNQTIQQVFLQLEHYIEQDPEGKLRQCHPRKYPNCHCQFLSQKALLQNPPSKFTDLSRELGINYQTLKSHWEKKCKPLLQDIARELGYRSE